MVIVGVCGCILGPNREEGGESKKEGGGFFDATTVAESAARE